MVSLTSALAILAVCNRRCVLGIKYIELFRPLPVNSQFAMHLFKTFISIGSKFVSPPPNISPRIFLKTNYDFARIGEG
jgi:hypothetical protein